MESIQHPIPPVYDKNSKILILGSFPSVKSREGCFFYHHPQNRFWKTLAAVLNSRFRNPLKRNDPFCWQIVSQFGIPSPPAPLKAPATVPLNM